MSGRERKVLSDERSFKRIHVLDSRGFRASGAFLRAPLEHVSEIEGKRKGKVGMHSGRPKRDSASIEGLSEVRRREIFFFLQTWAANFAECCGTIPLLGFTLLRFIFGGSTT